ncbi:hypothetical protein ACQKCU_11265 [Heyndrickxia sporothermodurans]
MTKFCKSAIGETSIKNQLLQNEEILKAASRDKEVMLSSDSSKCLANFKEYFMEIVRSIIVFK